MKHDDIAGKSETEEKRRISTLTPDDFAKSRWVQRRACDRLGEGPLSWLECCKLAREEWEKTHGSEDDEKDEKAHSSPVEDSG